MITGRRTPARLYGQAWRAAQDDYDACIAAHYVARFQDSPEATLRWNQVALSHARASRDERVRGFYASLYINLGRSYEMVGNLAEAKRYYQRAARLGLAHDEKAK
jgi:tetratricopeptide (TPR) repeat protein